jgi:hypothetical protein
MSRFKYAFVCFFIFSNLFAQINKDSLSLEQNREIQKLELQMENFISERKIDLDFDLAELKQKEDSGLISFSEAQGQRLILQTEYNESVKKYQDIIDDKINNVKSTKDFNSKEDEIYKKKKRITPNLGFGFNSLIDNEGYNTDDFNILKSNYVAIGWSKERLLNKNGTIRLISNTTLNFSHYYFKDNKFFFYYEGVIEIDELEQSFKKVKFSTMGLERQYLFEFGKLSLDMAKNSQIGFKKLNIKRVVGLKPLKFGLGGFLGYNLQIKQKFKFSNKDKIKRSGNSQFNVNKVTYGVVSYIGYGSTALFVKYNLNPMFMGDTSKMNNVSIGIIRNKLF